VYLSGRKLVCQIGPCTCRGASSPPPLISLVPPWGAYRGLSAGLSRRMQRVGGCRIAYGIRMQHISAPSILRRYYIKELRGAWRWTRGAFVQLARLIPVAVNPRLFGKGWGSVGFCIIKAHRPWGMHHLEVRSHHLRESSLEFASSGCIILDEWRFNLRHWNASHGLTSGVSVYPLSIV
jgi:hypothetical protein